MNSGDQVHFAIDKPAYRGPFTDMRGPLTDTFYKNAIASGSIVPPSGESASVRRTDYMVGLCVICLVVCGLVGFSVAYFWRA